MFCMYVPMILFVRVQSILQIAQDQKKRTMKREIKIVEATLEMALCNTSG